MGILIGMVETETNPEIREISVKACHDSLGFMEALIQRNVRSFIALLKKLSFYFIYFFRIFETTS